MKRITLSILLTIAVLTTLVPSGVAQDEPQTNDPLYASLEQAFEAELTAYAANHTDAEVLAYAQQRMDQMTDDALANPEPTSTCATSSSFPQAYDYGEDSDDFEFCMQTRGEECRRNYNADLIGSSSTSASILAGCAALTTGGALIICVAAAMAAHAAGVASARERYQGCLTRAYSDCTLQYRR